MLVPRERCNNVKRCGQIGRPKLAALAVLRINDHVEAFLRTQRAAHPDALDESNEFRAAREIYMLSVVDDVAVQFKRRGSAAQQTAALEEFNVPSRILQFDRCGKPGEASADYCYTGNSHEPSTTWSFSPFESAARSRSGNCGSRSIFCSKRS